MAEDTKPTWRVVKTIPENEDVTSLVIETDQESCDLHGRPGQFASIRVLQESGWSEPHPFTISCQPCGKQMQFTIKHVDAFTSHIRDLKPGTEIQCTGPLGVFCKDIGTKEHIVMIAGGVGITPFLSVLRTFRNEKAGNEILLFWANKTLSDAFACKELAEMAQELNLTVVHALSREDPPNSRPEDKVFYESGRISREMLERYVKSPTASFYLCGPAAMQEALVETLRSCGVSPDAIEKEIFTPPKKK